MKKKSIEDALILSVFPSVRGFGFALFQGTWVPIDWGFRHVQGDKNKFSLEKVQKLIDEYAPDILLLENCAGAVLQQEDVGRILIDQLLHLLE